MKNFDRKGPHTAPREPFSLTVLRDEEPERHEFRARAVSDMASLAQTLSAGDAHPDRMVRGMMTMISKMLDNKDGVPSSWKPDPVEGPDGEPAKFRTPDGMLVELTAENTAPYLEFSAGSSKRRWLHLMNDDDDAEVSAEQIMELFGWLASLAGKDRTRASASSGA